MIGAEGLFNYYLYVHKDILEELLQVKLTNPVLEKHYKTESSYRKVDIVFNTITDRKVFVETQLGKSDKKHLSQVIDNIENVADEGDIIVWIAKKFSTSMIKLIEEKNMYINKEKKISFYALTINEDAFGVLYYLYDKGNKYATENIGELANVDKLLEIYKEINQQDNRNNMLENINFYIKESIKDNYKFHFSRLINNYQMFYGSSRSDITYYISISKIGKVRIALFFAPCEAERFNNIIEQYKQIRTKSNMDISLTSKTRTIAYDIDYEVNTMQDCRKVAEAFTKFYYSMQKYISI
ncbi:hypothetical protein [Inconstantimicrobium porci]|uniref:hypothetical protein n=1 Tax=Inconstantimicrobium porci TaxID=2652291 RepID=UPI00240A9833|nr:hypothetical protein [Inconstantimicrobium porci]MDD6771382.1 hypothetical protein [Inconstantimicrobium porci]